MPPAVAHAPMVISVRDWSRIRWMRSASAGVVTDPSTSEMSYGPASLVLVASVKCAMSISAARASSSSWQSSSVSWQKSQDASFHTASFGRVISQLPYREQRRRSLITDDGAVPAQQQRAELAMAAFGDAAAHVPLQRDPDASRRDAAGAQLPGGQPHHHLGAAEQRQGGGGVDLRPVDELGHHADVARPARRCPVDGEVHAGTAVPPAGQLDRKSTRLNSSHVESSYAVFCLKKKKRGS